ncbi:MAG: CoB--CoM heterodisulfide reductase iron-sulfur subunit A family protein [Polyangiaceae bacterium]|nr:CoB--CoM heterodisulfide reductase iron-sulfur subunit A family protein [Polyangiaceae bacterium]
MSDQGPLTVPEGPRGRLLVVGGGIAGLSAAIEAAEAGFGVALVEREAYLGGRVAQMHQYFPKLCPPLCGLEINLRRLRSEGGPVSRDPRRVSAPWGASGSLAYLTLTEVQEITRVSGGRHRVRLRQRPRFVTARCTACGACTSVCPVERPHPFDLGLRSSKAIALPHAAAFPTLYAIDRDACEPSCTRCVSACPQQAIDLGMPERELELEVAAVIWATGWEPYGAKALTDLGFGAHPDVITNLMLERLAAPQGPTGGRITCPSDGRVPERVAFVQCAGSRDVDHLEYCSGVCCLASAKQARYLRAAHPGVDVSIYYIDRRAAGNQERFLATTAEDERLQFVPGKVARVDVSGRFPVLEFENVATGRLEAATADLVVLATGMVPSQSDTPAFRELGRDAWGFLTGLEARTNEPSAGQFVAGCARQPMDVSSSVRDATSAVARALAWGRTGRNAFDRRGAP